MGFLRRWPRRGVVVGVVFGVAATVGVVALAVQAGGQAPVTTRNVRIGVVDGPGNNLHVWLDATFFTPAGTAKVPAVLLAHGFGQTKDAVKGEAVGLARAGFAVLTWSSRGFGASTGQIALDSPQYEVKDVEQLVTWLARQPRVLLDGPGDPRVGIAGASYGGALALLAAGYDHRIDAVVPEITWNDLATALFPNAGSVLGSYPPGNTGAVGPAVDGVFKRQWAGLLFSQSAAGFARAAECGRFLPSLCAMYNQVASTGLATPQALAVLRASSPATVASRIAAPTLLIQGENDSLFGLDQAAATYRQITANGTPADMVWFNGGHDGGNQETGRVDALAISWFDRWLKGRPWRPGETGPADSGPGDTGQPGFAVSRELGFDPSTGEQSLGIATASAFPGLAGSAQTLVRLDGQRQVVVQPPGGVPPSMSVFPGLGVPGGGASGSAAGPGFGLAFDMPGQSAAFESAPLAAPLQVTGAPRVFITVRGPPGLTLFAKLYDVDQAGNATLPFSLAAPIRVARASSTQVVDVRLPTIDYQFAAGHRIRLVLTTTDFAYATPGGPAVYEVGLASPGVVMPSDPALELVGGGLGWWVWVAPAAALALAALVLATGRRRTTRKAQPAEADTPLVISKLTKRYRDGQLAVDDLDLRVERGQILGLLGPNGAGKTTTLRALMGLIGPTSGTITIFGRQVRAGSPALARLGAFVEGPGFLPHLSGRDNLTLYWRSVGRSADSHMDEVLAIAGLGDAVDRKVRSYSRGMCQRLAIAQAMLGLPDLLVLDEPLNGLDPPQIRQMRDVLVGYAAGGLRFGPPGRQRAVILSSHLLAEVEMTCTHVVVMHLGRQIAAGPVAEIAGDGGALLIGTPAPAQAVAVLAAIDGVAGVHSRPDGVLVRPGTVGAADLVAALVQAGVPVERVAPSRRLEEAFLALIGPAEADGPADPPGDLEPAGAAR